MPWHTSSDPLTLPAGKHYSTDNHLRVEPGAGNVQVQQLRSDGVTWFTPSAAEYTISVEDSYRIDRRNAPPLRIIATGDAKFELFGALT